MDLASTHPAILAAIGALLLINTVVTVGLIKDVAATAFQKVAQGLVIWIIPFVGAGLILAFIGPVSVLFGCLQETRLARIAKYRRKLWRRTRRILRRRWLRRLVCVI